MTRPASTSPASGPPAVPGAVRTGELYRLAAFKKMMGWGHKPYWVAKRKGLRTIPFGRQTYVRGDDVLAFFEKLAAEAQAKADAETNAMEVND